jgi:hypothetical protein
VQHRSGLRLEALVRIGAERAGLRTGQRGLEQSVVAHGHLGAEGPLGDV